MTKVSSLSEAVASIHSGAHVALSGFAITRCTMAFAREVIRQGIKKLTISQSVGAMDADLLVGGGAVARLIYGGGSLDRFGRLRVCVNAGIESGSIRAEEYSSLSIAFVSGRRTGASVYPHTVAVWIQPAEPNSGADGIGYCLYQ